MKELRNNLCSVGSLQEFVFFIIIIIVVIIWLQNDKNL